MGGPGSGDTPSHTPPGVPLDASSDAPSPMPPDAPSHAAPDAPPDVSSDVPFDVPFDERVADFYSPGVPLNGVRPRPRATTVPADLLLRILEPPPVKVRHIPLVDLLRKPYRELGGD